MPREISRQQCEAHEQSLSELTREKDLLWTEHSRVGGLLAEAATKASEALALFSEFSIHLANIEHLREVAIDQLTRCTERAERDCATEKHRVTTLDFELALRRRQRDAAYARYVDAEARRDLLSHQLTEILTQVQANKVRMDRHERDMRNGHCHRFRTP